MVFQRASCFAAADTSASAALLEKEQGSRALRGLQCLFSRRGESYAANGDLRKPAADANLSILSTDDIASELGSSMDAHSTLDAFEAGADGFFATLPPLVEVATFRSVAPISDANPATEGPTDEARLLAQRAHKAFLERRQCRLSRELVLEAKEVAHADSEQPRLVRQLAERICQQNASH